MPLFGGAKRPRAEIRKERLSKRQSKKSKRRFDLDENDAGYQSLYTTSGSGSAAAVGSRENSPKVSNRTAIADIENITPVPSTEKDSDEHVTSPAVVVEEREEEKLAEGEIDPGPSSSAWLELYDVSESQDTEPLPVAPPRKPLAGAGGAQHDDPTDAGNKETPEAPDVASEQVSLESSPPNKPAGLSFLDEIRARGNTPPDVESEATANEIMEEEKVEAAYARSEGDVKKESQTPMFLQELLSKAKGKEEVAEESPSLVVDIAEKGPSEEQMSKASHTAEPQHQIDLFDDENDTEDQHPALEERVVPTSLPSDEAGWPSLKHVEGIQAANEGQSMEANEAEDDVSAKLSVKDDASLSLPEVEDKPKRVPLQVETTQVSDSEPAGKRDEVFQSSSRSSASFFQSAREDVLATRAYKKAETKLKLSHYVDMNLDRRKEREKIAHKNWRMYRLQKRRTRKIQRRQERQLQIEAARVEEERRLKQKEHDRNVKLAAKEEKRRRKIALQKARELEAARKEEERMRKEVERLEREAQHARTEEERILKEEEARLAEDRRRRLVMEKEMALDRSQHLLWIAIYLRVLEINKEKADMIDTDPINFAKNAWALEQQLGFKGKRTLAEVEAEFAKKMKKNKDPDHYEPRIGVVPPSLKALIMQASLELRPVPEEHKQEYKPIASMASEIGQFTRLKENVIEAMGTGEKSKKKEPISSLQPWTAGRGTVHMPRYDDARSEQYIALQEAAALGRLKRLRPDEIRNYNSDDSDFEQEDEVDVDDIIDEKVGGKDFRIKYLTDRHIKNEQKFKAQQWDPSLIERRDFQSLDDVVLPVDKVPVFRPNAPQLSRTEYMDALSKGVAEASWERRYRLDRPGAVQKISEPCQCKWCVKPNAYQTHAYRRKWLEQQGLYYEPEPEPKPVPKRDPLRALKNHINRKREEKLQTKETKKDKINSIAKKFEVSVDDEAEQEARQRIITSPRFFPRMDKNESNEEALKKRQQVFEAKAKTEIPAAPLLSPRAKKSDALKERQAAFQSPQATGYMSENLPSSTLPAAPSLDDAGLDSVSVENKKPNKRGKRNWVMRRGRWVNEEVAEDAPSDQSPASPTEENSSTQRFPKKKWKAKGFQWVGEPVESVHVPTKDVVPSKLQKEASKPKPKFKIKLFSTDKNHMHDLGAEESEASVGHVAPVDTEKDQSPQKSEPEMTEEEMERLIAESEISLEESEEEIIEDDYDEIIEEEIVDDDDDKWEEFEESYESGAEDSPTKATETTDVSLVDQEQEHVQESLSSVAREDQVPQQLSSSASQKEGTPLDLKRGSVAAPGKSEARKARRKKRQEKKKSKSPGIFGSMKNTVARFFSPKGSNRNEASEAPEHKKHGAAISSRLEHSSAEKEGEELAPVPTVAEAASAKGIAAPSTEIAARSVELPSDKEEEQKTEVLSEDNASHAGTKEGHASHDDDSTPAPSILAQKSLEAEMPSNNTESSATEISHASRDLVQVEVVENDPAPSQPVMVESGTDLPAESTYEKDGNAVPHIQSGVDEKSPTNEDAYVEEVTVEEATRSEEVAFKGTVDDTQERSEEEFVEKILTDEEMVQEEVVEEVKADSIPSQDHVRAVGQVSEDKALEADFPEDKSRKSDLKHDDSLEQELDPLPSDSELDPENPEFSEVLDQSTPAAIVFRDEDDNEIKDIESLLDKKHKDLRSLEITEANPDLFAPSVENKTEKPAGPPIALEENLVSSWEAPHASEVDMLEPAVPQEPNEVEQVPEESNGDAEQQSPIVLDENSNKISHMVSLLRKKRHELRLLEAQLMETKQSIYATPLDESQPSPVETDALVTNDQSDTAQKHPHPEDLTHSLQTERVLGDDILSEEQMYDEEEVVFESDEEDSSYFEEEVVEEEDEEDYLDPDLYEEEEVLYEIVEEEVLEAPQKISPRMSAIVESDDEDANFEDSVPNMDMTVGTESDDDVFEEAAFA